MVGRQIGWVQSMQACEGGVTHHGSRVSRAWAGPVPVRLPLRRVMFPELDVGVGITGETGDLADKGAVGGDRHRGESVKSVAIPITSAASAPASPAPRSAARPHSATAPATPSSAAEPRPAAGRTRSTTAWGYSNTAEPSSAPSLTRTTTARPDKVPKSTPTAKALGFTVTGDSPTCSSLRCER